MLRRNSGAIGDDQLAPPARLATGGVWDLIHSALLDWLARTDQIVWTGAIVDSCSIRAVHGGDQTGPNPTDWAKRGSKRHPICDGRGAPLAVRLTGANRNDSQEALRLWMRYPPLQGEWGRRRQRPNFVFEFSRSGKAHQPNPSYSNMKIDADEKRLHESCRARRVEIRRRWEARADAIRATRKPRFAKIAG
jgi:hypothetical protein